MGALAGAHQTMGHTTKALDLLKEFLRVTTKTKNLKAQAKACLNLGVIYNQERKYSKAVEYFMQNYELCRTLVSNGDAKLSVVDKARVYLGMTRGNKLMNKYINVINHDTRSLL